MSLPKRAWMKKFGAVAVREFAADMTAPLQVENKWYARKLNKDALSIARRKSVLLRAHHANREKIAHGIEKSLRDYRGKVIFWSWKNALRAADIPLARRRDLNGFFERYAAFLSFVVPHSMRELRRMDEFSKKEKKQQAYAQAKIDAAVHQMESQLDILIGVRKRRDLIHYFSLLYEGGHMYRQAVEHHLGDPAD